MLANQSQMRPHPPRIGTNLVHPRFTMAEEERPHSPHLGDTELFRLLVESVQDYAIFLLDPEGRVQSWNEGADRILGYTAEDAVGRHFEVFFLPEEVRRGKPEYELRVAASEDRWEDEGWRVRRDGTRFWANAILTALRDESGNLISFAKIIRDLGERRQAEEIARTY